MKPHVIHSLSSEIAFGLHELLRTNAANIHKSDDWFTLFSLLEVVGAAAHPPPVLQTTILSNSTNEKPSPISRMLSNTQTELENESGETSTTSLTEKEFNNDSDVIKTK